jgi:predicted small integral membrane protein
MKHVLSRRGRPTSLNLPRMFRGAPAILLGTVVMTLTVTVMLVVGPQAVYAADTGRVLAAAASIQQVVNNIRAWLVAILVAVATLFLTVGGLRYLAANGDPGEVEKAKSTLRSATLGYALALLAPLFVTIVGKWVA